MKLLFRIKPNAKKSEFLENFKNEHDELVYKVAIKAPPLEGKANAELIKFLSEKFEIPQKDIDIIAGKTSVNKLVLINCNTPAKEQKLWQILSMEKLNPSLF